jgi:hypothetical protein
MKHNIVFVFASLVFMYAGRRLGWALSKGFFYSVPPLLSAIGTIIWGIVVGWGISSLIGWEHPNLIVKWIMGFALGAYVAVPNYGMIQESTIPDSELARHIMISFVSLIAYVVTEFATGSLRS